MPKTNADTSSRARIERAGPADLTVLATDRGPVPMNIGAILEFDASPGPDLSTVSTHLAERIPRIPRLRQRLQRVPVGCGHPVWVDDPGFALEHHLTEQDWPAPAGERELLDLAAEFVCTPLSRDRPLWQARLVVDRSRGRAALIVVLHHVLADGLGGLAVLAALTDSGPRLAAPVFPQPPPSRTALAADAARAQLAAVRALPVAVHRGFAGLRELGLGRSRPHLVEPTSLNRPTSSRRRVTRIVVPLAEVTSLAHSHHGTVNDIVVAAVTGAMLAGLRARGERPGRLVVSVPISGRRSTTADRLGNVTGVRPVSVPAIVDDEDRLTRIVAATSAAHGQPARASSGGPLGLAFRALGRLGMFRLFIDHQRMVHTFVTNLRGPAEPVELAGFRVRSLVPLVVTPGNVGVTFAVLSYAGDLGITLVADPAIVSDQDEMAQNVADTVARLQRCTPSTR
ncbi:wax ester/triacylglycerol synthase domain-containing protein [Rhodococcus zopfii]|uniref:wax ester/triacylglycerol synthase domain-containing protein n=1 Tax=Rhodococcus zopfii TaxID=43772 RepID=UPI001111316E|nr:wax ester/triacylglycerol synthase domain-containing protein [Rhodococcus zopfii]